MPIPVMLATAAACGSLVTTMKVGWEFSRMLRQKIAAKEIEEDSVRIRRRLRSALHSGRMSKKEYDYWYDEFVVAIGDRDLSALRKIRTHLRIVYEHTPSQKCQRYHSTSTNRNRSSNTNNSQTHSRHDEPRGRSVRFKSRPLYVPDPPNRYQDLDVPPSAGSIEYFPMQERGRSRDGGGGGSSNTSGEDGPRHEKLGYRSRR